LESDLLKKERLDDLMREADELTAIFTASEKLPDKKIKFLNRN
jgi:hypothetical protein